MINIFINSGLSFFSLRKLLILHLLKKKEKLTIYTPNNTKNIKKAFKKKSFKVLRINLSENKSSLLSLISNIINCYRKYYHKSSDINLVFGTYMNLIIGIILLNIKSKKNIFIFTGLGSFFNNRNIILIYFIKKLFNLILSKKNSFFIFYNLSDRNSLVEKKFFKKTKIILGSGINYKKSKKIEISYSKKISFVYYSRFNYDKGIIELLDAIEQVNKKGFTDEYYIYFYGLFDNNPTSISKKKLKKKIYKFDNCSLKEINYDYNLYKIFRNKQIFVLPSHREGLPKTALEAMKFNKALLLSNIPGHKYLISKNKINGIYFKKKDMKDLSKKIIWMIKNKQKVSSFMKNSHLNLVKFSAKNVNKIFYETIKK